MSQSLTIGASRTLRPLAYFPLSLLLLAAAPVAATAQTAVQVSTSTDTNLGWITLDDATLIASDGSGLPGRVSAVIAPGPPRQATPP